jgi:hypothetical protein
MAGARGPGAYARALEQALGEIRERPVVLSPRDWMLVVAWHEREIPLAVILEVLGASARKGGGPRSLAYIAAAVDEAWNLILDGRAGSVVSGAPTGGPTVSSVRKEWDDAATAAGEASALFCLLHDLLARLDRGEPAVDLDRELDAAIASVRPPDEVARIESEVDDELMPFRGRLPPHRLAETRARAVAARLRTALRIPRLSMTSRS